VGAFRLQRDAAGSAPAAVTATPALPG